MLQSFIKKADISHNEEYGITLDVSKKLLTADFENYYRSDILVGEKKCILFYLTGQPINEIEDPAAFSRIRKEYSEFLVDYVGKLQADRIPNFKTLPVYLNSKLTYNADPNEEKRQEEENSKNNDINNYQLALERNIKAIVPHIKRFIETYYNHPPLNQAM